MKQNRFPAGWDEGRVRKVLTHYEAQTEEEAAAEDEAAEVRAWWDSLTEGEREAERAKIRESLAAADAGRSRPAAKVHAHIRAKHAS